MLVIRQANQRAVNAWFNPQLPSGTDPTKVTIKVGGNLIVEVAIPPGTMPSRTSLGRVWAWKDAANWYAITQMANGQLLIHALIITTSPPLEVLTGPAELSAENGTVVAVSKPPLMLNSSLGMWY